MYITSNNAKKKTSNNVIKKFVSSEYVYTFNLTTYSKMPPTDSMRNAMRI